LKNGSNPNGTFDAGSVDNVADAASIGFYRRQWLPTKVNREHTRMTGGRSFASIRSIRTAN
jgi:hypothetical protein